jgi:hypothetical protein
MSELFAAKGEHVTCPNGHVVCTIARDLHVEDQMNPAADFVDWVQSEPAVGTPTSEIRCETCGKWWITTFDFERVEIGDGKALVVRSGNALCIEGDWRSPEDFPPEPEWPEEMKPD